MSRVLVKQLKRVTSILYVQLCPKECVAVGRTLHWLAWSLVQLLEMFVAQRYCTHCVQFFLRRGTSKKRLSKEYGCSREGAGSLNSVFSALAVHNSSFIEIQSTVFCM
eukprot:gb/GECG01016255.1/.p1 GENE.gb/GECG01016255.1/~~gb/GECG01016255.1/.p1  ORF type:complete len:108 (+),score=6.21 gb/GECG01016255.1/:1-324(+)